MSDRHEQGRRRHKSSRKRRNLGKKLLMAAAIALATVAGVTMLVRVLVAMQTSPDGP